MEKGQIIYASGSFGVILDVLKNDAGERVYLVHFAKNAVRLQLPELQPEKNLVGLRSATRDELEAEIKGLKAMISQRLNELQGAIVEQPEESAQKSKPDMDIVTFFAATPQASADLDLG